MYEVVEEEEEEEGREGEGWIRRGCNENTKIGRNCRFVKYCTVVRSE